MSKISLGSKQERHVFRIVHIRMSMGLARIDKPSILVGAEGGKGQRLPMSILQRNSAEDGGTVLLADIQGIGVIAVDIQEFAVIEHEIQLVAQGQA